MPEVAARDVRTLVVGAGGLLGSSVVRDLRRHGRPHETVRVPWSAPEHAADALSDAAERLLFTGRPWRLLWCAGAGVVATSQPELDAELSTLRTFLDRLAARATGAAPGGLFLASSAGGVYAGSSGPPFTERTEPRPISPYGHAKVAAENAVRDFAVASGVPAFIGRIANLYGPGQDPQKAQGLITVLCRSHLARRPASIYVSLDTARDYVFVDDAARVSIAGVERVAREQPGTVVTKVIASQQGTTVAAILGELRRITKHRPKVVLGASPLARFQVRDLRFRSEVWPDLDGLVTTSLPAGMAATMRSATSELGLAGYSSASR